MKTLVEQLFIWAVTLSGYPDPDMRPNITALPTKTIMDEVCGGVLCNAVAYYDADTETIFYNENMDFSTDHYDRSFLVHEMVHFLQHKQGKLSATGMSCQERIALEQKAYQIQLFFLKEHKQQTYDTEMALAMLPSACQQPDS
ncbi:hypothetical protein Q7C_2113 [Methylophaga frappieri]|uniref:IrrE N-terminal-like domain-containing protein n=1 Tax=Methylophaga frappieri (strain ATCC BAA-2434 / DSM 25690 / JAM7) TaxID=754477 RepID=I1YK06_METFJ|nr:hypothetical protein [Methylophaga frappieri]AFJ03249.1 hypothetical protein Q7C_2113 [Methylophaga frappieri]